MAVTLPALRVGRPFFTPIMIPGRSQGHSAAGRNRSIEKSNALIGNQTRDLPASRRVPQSNTHALLIPTRHSFNLKCVVMLIRKLRHNFMCKISFNCYCFQPHGYSFCWLFNYVFSSCTIRCRMVGWQTYGELDRIWIDPMEVPSRSSFAETEGYQRTAGAPAEIRTTYLPHTHTRLER
jgi:hypothetical protein